MGAASARAIRVPVEVTGVCGCGYPNPPVKGFRHGVVALRRHGVDNRIGAMSPRDDNQSQMAMTLMIVDDHRSFRDAARRVLESAGFEIVGEAVDGESALEAIPVLRPDIVLLDVHLPGIDGFEVAERLNERADAPLIVMTSSRDRAHFGPLVEQSGARGFIDKADLSGPAISAVLA